MRWKCTCSYDGGSYAGWQSQSDQISVQQVIEEGLEAVFKIRVSIAGSGRTDSGVHALEQVFHFDFGWEHGADRLLRALYTKLPRDVQVMSATPVDDSFHARFSARSKKYHYKIFLGQADPFRWPYCWSIPQRLDLNAVRESLRGLVGEHDFGAFAANRGYGYESTVRSMTSAELTQDSEYVYLTFEANGFMYKMARSLAGALVNVGLRKMKPEDIAGLLVAGNRIPLVQVAPARGLYLEKVFY